MSDARRLVALLLALMGLGLAVFGILRGLSATGPARGVRMIIALVPPIDAAAVATAQQVVIERVDEKGFATRVVPAGDKLVLEVGETDAEIIARVVDILQRTATLRVLDAATQEVVLDVPMIRGAELLGDGVAIAITDARQIKPGMSLAFEFEGKVRATHAVDAVTATNVHVKVADTLVAFDLVAMIQAGAVRPLRVVKQEAFTRTTGFVPRAWPFLAIGGLLTVIGAVLGLRRRRS